MNDESRYLKYLNENKKSNELENSSPYQSFAKEIKKLNEQIEELEKERLGLKQQCRAAIQQWDKTLHENNDVKHQLMQVQQQRDEALKKINHEISQRVKVTEERNSAVHEYNLIMSERDTVHKEMEKLNEELGQCHKRMKSLDGEKKTLLETIENLKKEIIANKMKSMDKEFLMKQIYKEKCNDTHFGINQYGIKSITSSNNKWSSSSSGFSSGWTQYGNLKNSFSPTNSKILQSFNSIDTKQKQFSISNNSSVSTIGNKNKIELSENELELRKQIQTLESEYNKVFFEFNNSLLQNEKVIQERESIKTLCDKLRRERDRAIRDRAEAIQDLNDLRVKIESNAYFKKNLDNSNEVNLDQNKSKKTNNASKDSAISADIQEAISSDYESMSVLLVNNFRQNNSKYKNPWGFSIRSNEKNVFVSGINMDSPAEEKLKLNDIILSINSINIGGDESLCNELLCKYDKDLQLVIQRKKQMNSILNVDLDCSKCEHGIVLENAFLIKKLLPDCAAIKNEDIWIGDRLLSINGNSLENSNIHDVMRMLHDHKLLLKIYKQNLNNQNASTSVLIKHNLFESISHNQRLDNNNYMQTKFSNNISTYPKDDLHLTTSSKSNYSPNIGHYQSIKRSSKKSKVLLNDSSSSFGTEYDKSSPTLLNKTFNLFKKSYKSKNDKKEEKTKKTSPETETLNDFNKILNNLSERDSKNKMFTGKSSNDKNSMGTWPSCKSNTNLLISPTYGKVNPSTTHSKKKERKSLAIFTNYTKNDDQGKSNFIFESSKDHLPDKSMNDYSKDYKSFNDYHQYGIIQSSKTSRTNTPVLDNSYKSLLHNQSKHNERSLSSSYSSKDNYHKSNNAKKYTLNHHEIVYKSFNAPSSSSSIQMDQEYQAKKSKEKKYLDAYHKERKFNSSYSTSQQQSYPDLQDEKNAKDAFLQLSRIQNSSMDFYLANKIQLNANNLTQSYNQDLEPYLNNNGSVDQGLTGSNGTVNHSGDVETSSTMDSFFPTSLIEKEKSSPININKLKALNSLSITSSPSYHLNDNLSMNSPSHHFAFSYNKNAQHLKDNYYLNKQNFYERTSNASSNTYGCINQASPKHQSTINSTGIGSNRLLNSYGQDEFLMHNKNQQFHISSNNSVASKLSNCSVDSNSIHLTAIGSSSNYFKKTTTNESLDSASYSNIQNLRNHGDLLKRTKNSSTDQHKFSQQKAPQNVNKKSIDCESKAIENSLEMSSNYSTLEESQKTSEIRTIYIEKSKEKSLGIQIECGNSGKLGARGIFVSCVNEGSLAKQVGLKVGDQLLEICGINMRSANKDAAANVLRQCGHTVIMKVQYNPSKFFSKGHIPIDQKDLSSELNIEEKVGRETNLDRPEDEDKADLGDTLKNYHMNARQEISSETIDRTDQLSVDKEEDAYTMEKFLYF